MQSHIRKVHARLAVTCHLHFWQNDQDLLCAIGVVWVRSLSCDHTPGCGFHRSVVFVEFLSNIFIIFLRFLYQRVGYGCVLVSVLCIAAPGLQNYLHLFVSSFYHELGHAMCAIVGFYTARCLARTATGNVELCSQLSGWWGLQLHPTPWVWMYRPSRPVQHKTSPLVLSGSASSFLLDLSPHSGFTRWQKFATFSQNVLLRVVYP